MSVARDERPTAPLFVYGLRQVTEAAALAAWEWVGRGDKARGDASAVQAMRAELARLPVEGTIIIGTAANEGRHALARGEHIGRGGAAFDIAVDPVEGTSYLAKGMTNAMAVLTMAPHGTLFDPGPAFYMEKFAGPPAVKGRIDPASPVEAKLSALSEALAKPVEDLTIYVLEKPRHRELVERIHAAGARVALYPAGDVAGAVMAAIPDSGIDALMGTGGSPEGVISACAVRALGGEFLGRLDPQLATERVAVEAAGLDIKRWHRVEDLVASPEVYFCATGITTGLLLEGIERTRTHVKTQTTIIGGPAGERQLLTTFHRRAITTA